MEINHSTEFKSCAFWLFTVGEQTVIFIAQCSRRGVYFTGSSEYEWQCLEVLSVGGPDPGGTCGFLEGKGLNRGWCWKECSNSGRFPTEVSVPGGFVPRGGHGVTAIVTVHKPARILEVKVQRFDLRNAYVPGSLANLYICQLEREKVLPMLANLV